MLVRSFVRHGLALDTPNSIVGMSKAFGQSTQAVPRGGHQKSKLRKAIDKPLIKGLSRDIPDGRTNPFGGGCPVPSYWLGMGLHVRPYPKAYRLTQQHLQHLHQHQLHLQHQRLSPVPRTFKRTERGRSRRLSWTQRYSRPPVRPQLRECVPRNLRDPPRRHDGRSAGLWQRPSRVVERGSRRLWIRPLASTWSSAQ